MSVVKLPLPVPYCVYTLYRRDELLYVGLSRVPETRLRIHRNERNFGKCVELRIIRWYKNILIARRYETFYIRKLNPTFNKMGKLKATDAAFGKTGAPAGRRPKRNDE